MDRKRPLLIYDGECEFCKRWIRFWQRLTEECVEYLPSQEVGQASSQVSSIHHAKQFAEHNAEQFDRSVILILPSGEVYLGAEAVFLSLTYAPHTFLGRLSILFLWIYRKLPIFRKICEGIYDWVARHR